MILLILIVISIKHRVTAMTSKYYMFESIIIKAKMEAVEYVFVISCYDKTKSIIDMILNIRTMNPNIINKIGFSLHISQKIIFSDDVDYFIYNKLKGNRMFPKEYNVITNNEGETKGCINIIKAMKGGLEYFKKAKYFIILAGDSIQIKYSPKFLHYPIYGFGVDYSATIQIRYQLTPDNKYYEHNFIRRIFELNNGSCFFAYGHCNGICMKRDLAEDFTNIWYNVNTYKNNAEMMYDNNVKFIDVENYVFATYLCNLKNKAAGLGLYSKLPDTGDKINIESLENTISSYFVGPISKHINSSIRKTLREKYGYNKMLKDIISSINNDNIEIFHPSPRLLYKQTKTKYYSSELCNYDTFELSNDNVVQGNQPRILYFEFKTTTTNDVCIFASGEPKKNNCFNIVLSKIICVVCLANNINEYHATILNDNKWHKVMIIVGINKVGIYVDDIQVLVRRHEGINTKGNRCIIGGSNVSNKPSQNHFEGYIRNFFYFSGLADPNYESSYFDDVKKYIDTNSVFEPDRDIILDSIIIDNDVIDNNVIGNVSNVIGNVIGSIMDNIIDNDKDIKESKKGKKHKKNKKYKNQKNKNKKQKIHNDNTLINSDSDTDTIEL